MSDVTITVGKKYTLELFGGEVVTGVIEGYADGMLFFEDGQDEVEISGVKRVISGG